MKKRTSSSHIKMLQYLLYACLFIDLIATALISWYKKTFGVTLAEILFTIKSPLDGANTDFLHGMILDVALAVVIFLMIAIGIHVLCRVFSIISVDIVYDNRRRWSAWNILLTAMGMVCVAYLFIIANDVDKTLKIKDYIINKHTETHIYEEYYIKPDVPAITSDNSKNLIHIYLESMETTYASADDGGAQPDNNYIPNLTRLAYDNISFSNKDNLGGYTSTTGTGYTSAAIFSAETGIPYAFPVDAMSTDYDDNSSFASATIALGDILHQKGYYQEFLCGSDASFGGRKTFYKQHGDFEIYDVNNALADGYITERNGWWGFDDSVLYRIAKDELGRISSYDHPFNLTILTVDTHNVGGWVCDLCEDTYPVQLSNVVVCADKQIHEFVNWCKKQPWYDNTVIIIHGDHPRMDTFLVDNTEYNERTVYNCFINTGYSKDELSLQYRGYTSMDMYPTILSAIGFEIPGNRLGLGTDMFSGKTTLCEELGLDYINSETSKYSSFYINNFS